MHPHTSQNDPRRKRDDFEDLAGEPSRDDNDRDDVERRERTDDLEELADEPVRDDEEPKSS